MIQAPASPATLRALALIESWRTTRLDCRATPNGQNKARYDRIQQNTDLQQARDAVLAAAEDWHITVTNYNTAPTELRRVAIIPSEAALHLAVRKLRALQQPAAPGTIGTPEERT